MIHGWIGLARVLVYWPSHILFANYFSWYLKKCPPIYFWNLLENRKNPLPIKCVLLLVGICFAVFVVVAVPASTFLLLIFLNNTIKSTHKLSRARAYTQYVLVATCFFVQYSVCSTECSFYLWIFPFDIPSGFSITLLKIESPAQCCHFVFQRNKTIKL